MKNLDKIVTLILIFIILFIPLNSYATDNNNTEEKSNANENICEFSWTTNPDQKYIKNENGEIIINKDKGNPTLNEAYIENVKIQLISVEYKENGQTIKRDFTDAKTLNELDKGEKETKAGTYYHSYSDGYIEYTYQTKQNNENVNFDEGNLKMPKGSVVTLKIVPDYEYQITSLGTNENKVSIGNNVSEFSFEAEKEKNYLKVDITKVENIVKSNAKGIVSGKILLSDDEISSGTVRLLVEDANITDAKKEEFQNEITRIADGYTISKIISISLNQVFYKGKLDEFWQGDLLKNLKKEATISLKFDKELDKDNTIILYNINDSEKYEKIKILGYDKETKTITFNAKSFSNYAIATKFVENKEENKESNTTNTENIQIIDEQNAINYENKTSPKFGYEIILSFVLIGVLIVGVIAFIINKNIKIT